MLFLSSVVVINNVNKKQLRTVGLFHITLFISSLWKARAGAQRRNLEPGANVDTTDECCLLIWSSELSQIAGFCCCCCCFLSHGSGRWLWPLGLARQTFHWLTSTLPWLIILKVFFYIEGLKMFVLWKSENGHTNILRIPEFRGPEMTIIGLLFTP